LVAFKIIETHDDDEEEEKTKKWIDICYFAA